jgi:hypothetical protein
MVHFTRYNPAGLFYSADAVAGSLPSGYPIRRSPDQRICAPPRGLSQLIAAFFVLQLQGIRHGPILRLTILLFPLAPTPPRHPAISSSSAVRRSLRASFSFYLHPNLPLPWFVLMFPFPDHFKYHCNYSISFSLLKRSALIGDKGT